jgi:hypothetical protein
MEQLVVENTFATPLTDEEHDRMGKRLDPCLEAHGARWIRSYLSLDRTRMVCLFEAADAEMVRLSYRSAGVSFERVWSAEIFAAKKEEALPVAT